MAKPAKETIKSQAEPRNFEKDLEELEGIVTALEEGGLSLDEALKRFEQGIRLARCCEKTLTQAEKKIEILTRNVQGEYETRPFDDAEEGVMNVSDPPLPSAIVGAAVEGEPDDEEDEEGAELLF